MRLEAFVAERRPACPPRALFELALQMYRSGWSRKVCLAGLVWALYRAADDVLRTFDPSKGMAPADHLFATLLRRRLWGRLHALAYWWRPRQRCRKRKRRRPVFERRPLCGL